MESNYGNEMGKYAYSKNVTVTHSIVSDDADYQENGISYRLSALRVAAAE